MSEKSVLLQEQREGKISRDRKQSNASIHKFSETDYRSIVQPFNNVNLGTITSQTSVENTKDIEMIFFSFTISKNFVSLRSFWWILQIHSSYETDSKQS